MATSTIEALSNRLVSRIATTASRSVDPGGVDFDIALSEFNSPGVPLALASWSIGGNGVTNMSVYRAQLDFSNQRVRVSGKNTSTSTLTLNVSARVLFLE